MLFILKTARDRAISEKILDFKVLKGYSARASDKFRPFQISAVSLNFGRNGKCCLFQKL